jgi:hypothetical protein
MWQSRHELRHGGLAVDEAGLRTRETSIHRMYSMRGPSAGGSCCNGRQPETTPTASTAAATSATVNGQYGGWRPCLYGNEIFVVVFRAKVLPPRLLFSSHPGNSTPSPEMTLLLSASLIKSNWLHHCY